MIHTYIQYYEINYLEYNLLHSIYGIPNVVLCFVAGNIIHKIGLRPANFLFFFIVLMGQILFTVSAQYHSYSLALAGRLLIG